MVGPDSRFKPVDKRVMGKYLSHIIDKQKYFDGKMFMHRFRGSFTIDEIKKFFKYVSDKIKQLMPESKEIYVTIAYDNNGNAEYKSSNFSVPGEEMKYESGASIDLSDLDITGFDIYFHAPDKYINSAKTLL